MNKIIRNICIASMSVTMVNAAIVETWNFNTATDTEGWTGNPDLTDPPIQDTSINGVDGVLTISGGAQTNNPQLFYTNNIVPGAGQASWEKVVFRVRQLDASGTASQTWDQRGTTMLVNPPGATGVSGGQIKTDGTANYTITAELDNSLLVELDISGSGGLNSLGSDDIFTIRFDPIGHSANVGHNYELDYVELSAIPEPATLGLVMAFGGVLLIMRRHLIM